MLRKVNLDEISDGRIYELNDMVKVLCNECRGCFKCCTGMGESITLDPYDIYMLQNSTGKEFQVLLAEGCIRLTVTDGLITPVMAMNDRDRCVFLNDAGRCSIHEGRPGMCRLFPLGRIYDDKIKYILQTGECPNTGGAKIKVSKWIGNPAPSEYEKYLITWHELRKALQDIIKNIAMQNNDDKDAQETDSRIKAINMFMLQLIYVTAYNGQSDFYEQYYERLKILRGKIINI